MLTVAVAAVILLVLSGAGTSAAGSERPFPTRSGLSFSMGYIYDPHADRDHFALISGFMKLDHDRAAFFKTPDFLRFKLEASAGGGWNKPWKGMFAVNMLSLCYIDRIAAENIRPYIEGGIGAMYTERRWKGQGLHFLHNPVAGAGVHITPSGSGSTYQISLRLFHASNGGLHRDNKAMNALLLSAGFIF